MTTDRTASATFNLLLQYLRNMESGNYYGTLQSALNAATTSQTIRALAIQMLDPAGSRTLSSASGVILKGGFSTLSDVSPTGYTSVTGPVQISSGSQRWKIQLSNRLIHRYCIKQTPASSRLRTGGQRFFKYNRQGFHLQYSSSTGLRVDNLVVRAELFLYFRRMGAI